MLFRVYFQKHTFYDSREKEKTGKSLKHQTNPQALELGRPQKSNEKGWKKTKL